MSGSGPTPYDEARKLRRTERSMALETLKELVEESKKRARSHYTPAKERTKWVKLTGQLLWYRDQVLRSLGYEGLEEELAILKAEVMKKKEPPPGYITMRRTTWKGSVKEKH